MAMRSRENNNIEGNQSEHKNQEDTVAVKKKEGHITIYVKKKTLIILGIVICLIGLSTALLLTQTRKIDGTWVRVNDDNGLIGMVVNVSNGQGIIVKEPDTNALGYGFKVGQVKWMNITKSGWGQYTFSDATSDDDTGAVYFDNAISKMEVSLDGKKLTLTVQAGELTGKTGLYQEWKKLENQ